MRRQLLSVILFVVISVVRVSNFGLCGQTCLVTLVRAPLSYAGGASIKQREIIGNFSIVIHCSQDSSQPLFVGWREVTASIIRLEVGVVGAAGFVTRTRA